MPDHEYRVVSSEEIYAGRVISLRRDTVAMPGGGDSVREGVHHPVLVVERDDGDRPDVVDDLPHAVPATGHRDGVAPQRDDPPLVDLLAGQDLVLVVRH
jgi:hypothetical protein